MSWHACRVDRVALGQLQPYGPPDLQDLRHCRLFSDFVPSFSKRRLLTSFAVFYFWRCRLAHPWAGSSHDDWTRA
eukprot:365068-Chlamydomonas_euryale.AAC.6